LLNEKCKHYTFLAIFKGPVECGYT
jgi:hypothetical protein